jgi:hypothetical protein
VARAVQGPQPPRHLGAHLGDGRLQEVDVGQVLGEEEALVVAHVRLEGLLQLRELLAQEAAGQLGQGRRVGLPGDQRRQDVPPGLAQDVGGQATAPSLTLAPSSVFCRRLASAARARTREVR